MLSPKETLLRCDDSKPGRPLPSELFKHLNRLAIVCRELNEVSIRHWWRKRPPAPSAIIYGNRITEIIRHRYYKVSRAAHLAQGQSQFITILREGIIQQ